VKFSVLKIVLGLAMAQSMTVLAAVSTILPQMPGTLPVDTRCVISVGAPVIDYGSLTRWQLEEAGNRQTLTFGKRTLMLSVVCPYSQSLRLGLRSSHAANGDVQYGSRGSLTVQVMDAQVDGHAVLLNSIRPEGVMEGGAQPSVRWRPGESLVATRNGQVIEGKTFNARVEIEPLLSESAARVSGREVYESMLSIDLIN